MPKRGIQSVSSTNCMALVVVSNCVYSGIVTRKPATAPTSAIQRTGPGSRSRPNASASKPATIGTQMERER